MNTTPQRPQPQKRRTRHTTISGEEQATPKLHSIQSFSLLSQQKRRTPQFQQHQRQAIKLQRQHSVSCCTPPTTGKLTPPQFMRFHKATGGSQASLFAGSKFMDSPSPNTIPLPPIHWFSTDLTTPLRARTSPTPSSISDSMSLASSFEDSKSTSSSEEMLTVFEHSRSGFRVNPMQLIAAVSALV